MDDERIDSAEGIDGIPDPPAVPGEGAVVWHRDDLRVRDHLALARAADAGTVLPLFVFDPAFYGEGGLACDARIRFLHECLRDLDDVYRSLSGTGLTHAHGDPIEVLERFRKAGWDVVAMASATGRYGRRRDDRAEAECEVRFVDGDGLVRGAENTRADWGEVYESWVTGEPHEWDAAGTTVREAASAVTIERIEDAYGTDPEKTRVPTGGRTAARERLEAFVERIADYPGNVSAPADAREGCSGLSSYLALGCLSVREVYQYVAERAPDCRGTEMFESRLAWNKHYEQKLADWPGWTDVAVNPELRGFNDEYHDPELVRAWKEGRTGYPMVDASMRCLRETGWLNFRMRAMCASTFHHLLAQPWRIGADHYYHHLIDADPGINYTQWQSQAGLVGRPTLRIYNPRKQVRDQDPDGEWIREWVPELDAFPARYLDAPEETPLAAQSECGVRIGEDYPYPVVEYEAARERFRRRYDAVRPDAAARLADHEVAGRASLSGGIEAAETIAAEHGDETEDGDGSQATFDSFADGDS